MIWIEVVAVEEQGQPVEGSLAEAAWVICGGGQIEDVSRRPPATGISDLHTHRNSRQ